MNIKDYIKKSARTDADLGDKNEIHWLLGSKNEFGELLSPLKKALVKGVEPDKNKLLDETGDVFWYISKGARQTNMIMPDTYAYEQTDDLITLIIQFDYYWEKKDALGLIFTMFNFCDMYELNVETVLQKNIDKLMARHPEGFDINNKKYTKKEQDAIK